ncbi:MAG: ABC transporter substrate-binding protein [Firmicutes bacterium]|nr:ABC transporter substrate-binding protein [Bacillota bacterium]
MINKNGIFKLIILITVIAMLGAGLAGCAPKPSGGADENNGDQGEVSNVEPVKIGVLAPLTGGLASIGEQLKNGNELAAKMINENGGIKSLGGAPLELIFLDGEGRQEVAMGEVERAIDQEKVSVVTGSFHSPSAMGATQVAERLKTPYLIQVAGADDITNRGFNYVTRVSVNLFKYGYDAVSYFDWLNKEKDAGIKKIALIFEDADFGQSTAKGSKEAIKDLGFELALDLSYPAASTQNMTPYVSKIKAANVDAVIATSFIADALLLADSIEELGLDAIKLGISGGFADPLFAENIGSKVESWFLADNFNTDIPGIEEVNNKYSETYNSKMGGHAAHAYQSILIIADAIERAASRDRDDINNALKETSITDSSKIIVPYKAIEFDEKGQNIYAEPVVIQYQDGERKTVFPSKFATSEPKF